MNGLLTRNWWAFVLQGIVAIALGVLAFVVPQPTLAALIAVCATYAIVVGVFAVVAGAGSTGGPRRWTIIGGVAGIAIGLFTIASPGTTAIGLVLLIGIWSITTGVAQVLAAYTLRREINGELLLVVLRRDLRRVRPLPRRGPGDRGPRGPVAHRLLRDPRRGAVPGRGAPSPSTGRSCAHAGEGRCRRRNVRRSRPEAQQAGDLASLPTWLGEFVMTSTSRARGPERRCAASLIDAFDGRGLANSSADVRP
jgi:hypothetical protein